MESDHISMIQNLQTLLSSWNMLVHLGFRNVYRLFIRKYAKVRMPISDLQKKAANSGTSEQKKCELTQDVEIAFCKLKSELTEVPILMHFEQTGLIIQHTDV